MKKKIFFGGEKTAFFGVFPFPPRKKNWRTGGEKKIRARKKPFLKNPKNKKPIMVFFPAPLYFFTPRKKKTVCFLWEKKTPPLEKKKKKKYETHGFFLTAQKKQVGFTPLSVSRPPFCRVPPPPP